jgi:pimeloyl-ACP methyl ester carboxylesterase
VGRTATAGRAGFERAYQDAVARWPVPPAPADVPTEYGRTHVLSCGAPGAPAMVLLPGSGATATAWADVAAELAGSHRVLAVDPPGQPGLSAPGVRPLRTEADVAAWLDQLLTKLGHGRAVLAGHSYGAWLAICAALHAPDRVSHLALLDPTTCLAPMSAGYLLRAVPLLARPSGPRVRRFLAWETGGRSLDPAWLAVAAAGHDLGRPAIVAPRRLRAGELAGLPVLVVTAAASRAHDPGRVALAARELLPGARLATLRQASHHTIPVRDAAEIAGGLAELTARPP